MHEVMTEFLVQQAETVFPIRKGKLHVRQDIEMLTNLPKHGLPVLDKQFANFINDLIDIDSGIDTSDLADEKKNVLNSKHFKI
jgi:hypothetical protein